MCSENYMRDENINNNNNNNFSITWKMKHVYTINMRIALLVILKIAGIVNILVIYLLYHLTSKLKEHRVLLCFLSGTTIVIILLESIY